MARFISVCKQYKTNGITITPHGYETNDPEMIKFLRSSPDKGNFFHEVMGEEEQKKAVKDFARMILENEPVPVEPMSTPLDMEKEQAAWEEQKAIKKAQAEEEAELAAEKKAKIEHNEEVRAARRGRKKAQ